MYITALQSDKFDKLPRGVVVCVALIATAYQFDGTTPAKSKWASGPFCYHILQVIRVQVLFLDSAGQHVTFEMYLSYCGQENIPCVGQRGLFHLSSDVRTRLKNLPSIQAKIDDWNRLFCIDYLEDDLGRGLRYESLFCDKLVFYLLHRLH